MNPLLNLKCPCCDGSNFIQAANHFTCQSCYQKDPIHRVNLYLCPDNKVKTIQRILNNSTIYWDFDKKENLISNDLFLDFRMAAPIKVNFKCNITQQELDKYLLLS